MIHPSADVHSTSIGEATRIWQFVVVLAQARIGSDCNICAHVLIENDVVIGDRVTVKSGVQLWDGLRVEDDVFIGPNVTFSNDKFPRSRQYLTSPLTTHIAAGASLGAGCTILPGLSIGQNAMVGAGAVVTRSVPFPARRYFMVFDVPSVETRGEHAHHACHQFLVCVRGQLSVVADDGMNREEFVLDRPDLGLHLPPRVWGIQYKYSADAVLLVFASHYYDADDYIRDYDQFLDLVGARP